MPALLFLGPFSHNTICFHIVSSGGIDNELLGSAFWQLLGLIGLLSTVRCYCSHSVRQSFQHKGRLLHLSQTKHIRARKELLSCFAQASTLSMTDWSCTTELQLNCSTGFARKSYWILLAVNRTWRHRETSLLATFHQGVQLQLKALKPGLVRIRRPTFRALLGTSRRSHTWHCSRTTATLPTCAPCARGMEQKRHILKLAASTASVKHGFWKWNCW